MARYFQHLDANDPLFQQVTELDGIDNTDPSFPIYYFKDGSKCNPSYIAKVGQDNIVGHYMYAELDSKFNKWELKVVDVQPTVQYGINADGQRVEIPDLYTVQGNGDNKSGKRVDVVGKPNFDRIDYSKVKDNAEMPMITNSNNTQKTNNQTPQFDFNFNNDVKHSSSKTENDETPNQTEKNVNSNNNFYIDVQYLSDHNMIVQFTYNGVNYQFPILEFINNAITKPEDKVVEKVVEREVIINKVIDDHIEIGLDDNQRSLIDNMIDMSQKDDCDIDMEITLSLPPVSVYKLIKSVYPKGMSNGFVNIIADRMQIKELKTAVAAGLLAYYDEDENIEVCLSDSKTLASNSSVDYIEAEMVSNYTGSDVQTPKRTYKRK